LSGPIHLYISSSEDLGLEREAVGQVVAALPLTLGWQISHTPLPGSLDAGLGMKELDARIRRCDLYALILGRDLNAPMGYELRSVFTSRQCLLGAYRKECSRSPSARDAVRTLDVVWQRFSGLSAFRARFRRDLLQALLEVGPTLGLDLADVERLLKDQQAEDAETALAVSDRHRSVLDPRGGAGYSGRILGREVWQPGEQD
jgi:hypothetical protein